MPSPHLAFLGAGNLASAMVDGLLASDPSAKARLACLGGGGESAARLSARTGIRLASSLADLLQAAELVVIAFKPQHLAKVDAQVAQLTAGKLVISVLAGKRLERLAQVFPQARNVVRAMPNTPAAIGSAITGYCSLKPLSEADRAAVESLLGSFGQFVALDEKHMDAVTALSGSGPAFLFEFVASLRDAGVAAGLPAETAARLAQETVLGSARLLARRKVDPEVLRQQVTSPNGTTLAGLKQLEAGNFRALIKATVLAAQSRAAELSREG